MIGDAERNEMEDVAHVMRQLSAQLAELTAQLVEQERNRNVAQAIIVEQRGIGNWGVAAVVACFCTIAMLLVLAMIVLPELHDNKAWIDLYRGQIAKAQSEIQTLKENQ